MCNYTPLYNLYRTSILLLSQTRIIINTTFKSAILTFYRKAQYEKQLKNWGFKKNRTKRDWEIMNRKIQLRKRIGKETDVYLDRQLLPLGKLRKETARQGHMTAIEQARLAFGELAMIS